MLVLGIDPGYGIVGYGLVSSESYGNYKAVDFGVINTPKEDSITTRLETIFDAITFLLEKYTFKCYII